METIIFFAVGLSCVESRDLLAERDENQLESKGLAAFLPPMGQASWVGL